MTTTNGNKGWKDRAEFWFDETEIPGELQTAASDRIVTWHHHQYVRKSDSRSIISTNIARGEAW